MHVLSLDAEAIEGVSGSIQGTGFGCEWLGHEEWQPHCKWQQQCTVLETNQANKAMEQKQAEVTQWMTAENKALQQNQGHRKDARHKTAHNKMCIATTNPHRMLVAISLPQQSNEHERKIFSVPQVQPPPFFIQISGAALYLISYILGSGK